MVHRITLLSTAYNFRCRRSNALWHLWVHIWEIGILAKKKKNPEYALSEQTDIGMRIKLIRKDGLRYAKLLLGSECVVSLQRGKTPRLHKVSVFYRYSTLLSMYSKLSKYSMAFIICLFYICKRVLEN